MCLSLSVGFPMSLFLRFYLIGPRGGHSTKNVHVTFEQGFSDRTLNAGLEIPVFTPKRRNWDKFWTPNAWNFYNCISLFGLCKITTLNAGRNGFLYLKYRPFSRVFLFERLTSILIWSAPPGFFHVLVPIFWVAYFVCCHSGTKWTCYGNARKVVNKSWRWRSVGHDNKYWKSIHFIFQEFREGISSLRVSSKFFLKIVQWCIFLSSVRVKTFLFVQSEWSRWIHFLL